MTVSVKSGTTCRRKKQCNAGRKETKRNNMSNVYVRSSKGKEPIKAEVVLVRGGKSARMIYCRMYDQEERDIAKAVSVLAKFAL